MTLNFSAALCAAVAAWMTFVTAAPAAECPRKDALGTSRVLAVDAATYPRVGLKSFPQTLPLEDHEVVLTFDDGPWPATDRKVLAVLAQECVRATFFLIGKPASEHPELVRRIAAEGHTIAHHTWTHHNLKYMKPEAAIGEIDKGIAAVETALHGTATTTPSTNGTMERGRSRERFSTPATGGAPSASASCTAASSSASSTPASSVPGALYSASTLPALLSTVTPTW